MVAAFRAWATERAAPLCNDPWARSLAGPEGFADAERYAQGVPFMEMYTALRTAFLDREATRWLDRGFGSVVLLGAGLDTRAARLAREGVRFFEVDHPATQEDKRARVARLPGYPADNAAYVPCDFATDDFVDRLASAGHRTDEPTFLIWEGVTYYLEEAAVRATVRRVAERLHPRSVIAFDHIDERMAAGQIRTRGATAAVEGVAQMGEPIRFGVDDALPLLFEEGMRRARSTRFNEIALNLTGSYERARMFNVMSVAVASVAEDVWV
jgi:methyltransferase (TIGR00027 family)